MGSIPTRGTMRKSKEEYNAYMRKYMLERYYRRKAEAIIALGGKCVKCGSTDNLELLEES